MIIFRVCWLVLIVVLMSGCGPGSRAHSRKPVWPAADARPIARQVPQPAGEAVTPPPNAATSGRPITRVVQSPFGGKSTTSERRPLASEARSASVRKSTGFAETQAGFVALPPITDEEPTASDQTATTATVDTEKNSTVPTPPIPAVPPPVTAVVEPERNPAPTVTPTTRPSPPETTSVATPEPSPAIPTAPAPIVPPPVAVVTDPAKGVTTGVPGSVIPPPVVPSSAGTEQSTATAAPPVSFVHSPPPIMAESPAKDTTIPAPSAPPVSPPPPVAVDTEKMVEPGTDKGIAAGPSANTNLAAIGRDTLTGVPNLPRTPDPIDGGKAPGFAPVTQGLSDRERLAELWTKRSQGGIGAEYPIGPGDLLSINVPGMDEIKEQMVRVSTDETITLPLVGTIQTSGKTGEEVRDEIRRRLETDFMHNPQVQLFVKEYRSRQVAVVGAVAKPGLYGLTSGTETILDMVSQAGGVTDEAASYLQFVPAQPAKSGAAKEIAATLPEAITNAHPGLVLMEKSDPVLIDLQNMAANNSQTYMLLPVWPGDVIMVPGGGEVLVDGWIEKPGSYKISRGLTVLGVIAAAGGSLFAADTSAIKVIRIKGNGEKAIFTANLEQIRSGQQQDIPVQGGDVIEVTASTAKLVPYGMYKFISTIFRVGASAPLF